MNSDDEDNDNDDVGLLQSAVTSATDAIYSLAEKTTNVARPIVSCVCTGFCLLEQ